MLAHSATLTCLSRRASPWWPAPSKHAQAASSLSQPCTSTIMALRAPLALRAAPAEARGLAQRASKLAPARPHPRARRLLLRAEARQQEAPPVTVEMASGQNGGSGSGRPPAPDDVVIVAACRTACCKAKKGGFKDTHVDDMLVAVLKETLRRGGVKAEEVGDVCLGTVFPPNSTRRANESRQALLLAGFPPSVPVYNVNRQCAAGLQAIANVAASIREGRYSIGIAGGVEHMTINPLIWEGSANPRVGASQDAEDVALPLGITAENVAERYSVPREVEDALAAASHIKAAAAQAAGKFKDEIVPVEAVRKDQSTGAEEHVIIDQDDGIRPDTTPEQLAKLKPYFKKDGTVTVGNSCQNTDAAAALLLMRRDEAARRALPVMATLRSFAAVGVPPAVMGIAPTVAIPKALHKAGLSSQDIDVFEINEAFASQAAYVRQVLGLDEAKVNPNGGAIALGHPAGCTGARLVVTLLHELARRANGHADKPQRGVVSLCTGSGMGAAAVFERLSSDSYDSSHDSVASQDVVGTLCQDPVVEARPGDYAMA